MIKTILVIGSVTSKQYQPLRLRINVLGKDRAQIKRMTYEEFEKLIDAHRYEDVLGDVHYFVMEEDAYELLEDEWYPGSDADDYVYSLEGGYVVRTKTLGGTWLEEVVHNADEREAYPHL